MNVNGIEKTKEKKKRARMAQLKNDVSIAVLLYGETKNYDWLKPVM